ncbi:MAG: hypothetical protein HXX20_20540 [Chloroflexi bacterium]|nr:hypothetical protein [Chloroflexota bacterium]
MSGLEIPPTREGCNVGIGNPFYKWRDAMSGLEIPSTSGGMQCRDWKSLLQVEGCNVGIGNPSYK